MIQSEPDIANSKCEKFIDTILKSESDRNKHEPWTKLNKTEKIEKLNEYAVELANEKNMNDEQLTQLQNYLIVGLERKRLSSVKDVVYCKKDCVIKSIPCLIYSQNV